MPLVNRCLMEESSFTLIQEWLPQLLKGAGITIGVGLTALVISIVFGIILALARLSKSRFLSNLALLYTTVIRGIPELLLILLIFYGGQQWLNMGVDALNKKGWISTRFIEISPFIAGSLTIGAIYAAYMAETFRGAILAVPQGQIEAASAYGLSSQRIFFRITFPQALRHALPGVGNNWMVMLKATALVSIISLQDIVRLAQGAAAATKHPFTFYLLTAVIFLLFTTISISVIRYLERKLGAGFSRG